MAEKQHVSFEQYLRSESDCGHQEFRVVILNDHDGIKFYIHPLGFDGDSRDFEVVENTTEDVTRWLPLSDAEAAGETEWLM